MKKLLIILFLSIPLILPAQDIGGDYYVATYGNDSNPGTYKEPWASWQRAVEVAQPGDTIYIRGGVYSPTKHVGNSAALMLIRPKLGIGRSGRSGAPICFFAYPGEKPILDGSRLSFNCNFNIGINIEYAEYLYFKGLTVRNLYQYRFPVQAHGFAAVPCANLTFENCTAHDISGRGFYFESGAWTEKYGKNPDFKYDTTRFINCDAFNLCDSIDHTNASDPTPGNSADGFKLMNYDYNLLYLDGCRAWNYSDDGFDPNPFGRVELKNCWAFNSKDIVFVNGKRYTMEGNGFKISARAPEYAPYPYINAAIISNCIAANCYGAGFYNNVQNYYQNNAIYYNNNAYKNGYGFAQAFRGDETTCGTVYKNNIVYRSRLISAIGEPYECALGKAPYVESNNTWDYDPYGYPYFVITDTVTITDADFQSLDVNQLMRPRKADGTLPDISFLKLTEGSDLIDAGIDVGIPYLGEKPDLGFAEHHPDGVVTIIPRKADDFGMKVFPNPVHDRVWIQTDESGLFYIRILDFSGRKVISVQMRLDEKENYPLALASLKPGIYIIEVSKGGKSVRKKLIVQ